MATILIVDDRPTNRQFLLTLLGYTGDRLLEAADGAQALELVRAERPDLVITDILMPTMDGYEFVQALRADPELVDTRVIFYSATYSVAEARALANACGVETVLPKPSEPQVIFDAVNRILGTAERLAENPMAAYPSGAADIRELSMIGDMFVDYTDELQTIRLAIDDVLQRGERLAAERERLQQLTRRFSDNLTSLQSVTARLTALEELILRLASEQSARGLMDKFLGAAFRIVGSKYAAIAILDEATEVVVLLGARGLDEELLRAAALDRASLPGSLFDAREPRREYAEKGGVQGLPPGHPAVRSFLGLHIATPERVWGWAYFAEKVGADEFTPEDARIAASMVSQLAARYENASLYHLVQSHAAQLQIEMTERKRYEAELKSQAQKLSKSNRELTQFNRLASGRELRMIELKQEVNDLAARLGRPRPYALAFMDTAAAGIVGSTPKLTEPPSLPDPSQTSNRTEPSQ